MRQDNYFVIAILKMCTDPELAKRFDLMGPVCLCTSYMRIQDTLSCLK